MKKIVALILGLVLALSAVSAFAEGLPAFNKKLRGDGDVETIIANHIADPERVKDMYRFDEGSVAIPYPVILSIELGQDKFTVWGNFYVAVYNLNGTVLECISGGEAPGIITVEKGENGWEITKEEYAGDGDSYDEDLKRFAGDNENLLQQYYDSTSNEMTIESMRLLYMLDYLDQVDVEITAYQDYGRDPVPLR